MGKTFKHTIEMKFNRGLIALKDIPFYIRQKWDRHNWDIGEFRALRKARVEKIMDKEMKNYE